MPILPLDHPEPFAATLGTMLYPGEDTADRHKARAFASQYLAEPLRQFHEEGQRLSYEALQQIALDSGARLDDLDKRWWAATAAGEMFKTYFALANTDPKLASWNKAVELANLVATRQRKSGVRSSLLAFRTQYLTVAHLWGVWSIREGKFPTRPEVGYDGAADFEAFLMEAEILRNWGQTWRAPRSKAEPPLPTEVWRVPEDWRPQTRRPDWPETGKVPALTIPEELLANLKPAGRPRKND